MPFFRKVVHEVEPSGWDRQGSRTSSIMRSSWTQDLVEPGGNTVLTVAQAGIPPTFVQTNAFHEATPTASSVKASYSRSSASGPAGLLSISMAGFAGDRCGEMRGPGETMGSVGGRYRFIMSWKPLPDRDDADSLRSHFGLPTEPSEPGEGDERPQKRRRLRVKTRVACGHAACNCEQCLRFRGEAGSIESICGSGVPYEADGHSLFGEDDREDDPIPASEP